MEYERAEIAARPRDAVPREGSHGALLLHRRMEGIFQLAQGGPRPLRHQLHPRGRAQGLVFHRRRGRTHPRGRGPQALPRSILAVQVIFEAQDLSDQPRDPAQGIPRVENI